MLTVIDIDVRHLQGMQDTFIMYYKWPKSLHAIVTMVLLLSLTKMSDILPQNTFVVKKAYPRSYI